MTSVLGARPAAEGGTGSRLARSASVATTGGAVAVLSGLVLDLTCAWTFGAGADTDAFVAAARLPLAITAVMVPLGHQVLVPTFAVWEAEQAPGRERDTRGALTTVLLGALLGGAALAGALALLAPLLLLVVAPGYSDQQRDLARHLVVVLVWVIPMTAAAEVLRGWLNAHHHVLVPAGMTAVLNLVAVLVVVLGPRHVEVLPRAYVAGAAAQLVVVAGTAWARGWRPALPRADARVGEMLRLLGRPTAATALNPVARTAETAVASFLVPGSATVLHYAGRLVSAIGGTVLFRAVMVAVLPRATRAVSRGEDQDASALADEGMRLLVLLSVPLTALCAVLAVPAATTVMTIGRLDHESALRLGVVVAVLALSFPASAVQRALLLPFIARRDTRVPLRNTAIGVGANLVLLLPCLLLDEDLVLPAVGAAYVLANVVNVWHARRALHRAGLPVPAVAPGLLLRTSVVSLLAAAVAAATWWSGLGPDLLRLVLATALGASCLLGMGWRR